MSTGSAAYLLLFVPAFMLCFAAVGALRRFAGTGRAVLICAFSVLFYALGETPLCFLVTAVLSLFVCAAVRISLKQGEGTKKFLLLSAALSVLLLLASRIEFFGFFPAGGAFLALRMLSLLLDAHRGKIPAEASLLSLFTYLWFFPTFTAGPVVLAGDFLPQIRDPRLPGAETLCDSLYLGAKGAAKRLFLAPVCLTAYYILTAAHAAPWLAALCWTLALYHDFSGCSDIARGIAAACGINVGENFRHPLAALSLRDFWRRWHISFGKFLVTYIYIPLGGSRCGLRRRLLAVTAVWAASALWHGVGVKYAAFGIYFAILVCGEHLLAAKWGGFTSKKATVPLRWLLTQILAVIGLAFLSPDGVMLVKAFIVGNSDAVPAAMMPYLPLLILSAGGAFPVIGTISGRIRKAASESGEITRYRILRRAVMTSLTVLYAILALAALAASSHAPALYENLAAGGGV